MNTPITYYGGKQRIAGEILSMIPSHKIYCEPYFGGGAVFFRKPKAGIEVINDHDNNLINFYLCVQNHFGELQRLIDNTLHSEAMYYYAKDIWNGRVEVSDIEKAWAVWMITNGSFNGSMYGGWKWCNGTSGSHSGIYLKNKRSEFTLKLRDRLEHVQISCREAIQVIQGRDSVDTFFYLDPPYPGSNQQHYSGYTHKDFYELLQLLSVIKGKFILSNYWSQTLKYHVAKYKWNIKSIDVNIKIANLNKRNRREQTVQSRKEILVYNYDIEKTLFDL